MVAKNDALHIKLVNEPMLRDNKINNSLNGSRFD